MLSWLLRSKTGYGEKSWAVVDVEYTLRVPGAFIKWSKNMYAQQPGVSIHYITASP
jgi:hypothetical protein